MDIFPQYVPIWISVLFLIAILFPIFMIANLAKKGVQNPSQASRVYLAIVGFYLAYLVYVSFASFNGWFDEQSLPPKILKFTTMPLLAFLLLLIFNLPLYKSILKNLPLADLVSIHIFRLMGSFFLILGFYQALPSSISILAGVGDIITAISSIFVARAIQNNKSYAIKLTWVWNSFGLLDILVTSATAYILTKISIETTSQGVEALAAFPFCFIPAFAPASIIFLHLSVFRQLLQKK